MKFNKIHAKTLSLDVQDIDSKTRKVVGYFSSFNTLDSDLDVIRKGAFEESIKAKGPVSNSNRKIAHLWNHNWDEPVGKLIELFEDDYGLKFVSQLGRSVKGQDVFLNYQDGILREHSIGFIYLEEGTRFITDSTGSYTEITNLDLYEGSTVTFGSNSLTPVLEVNKSLNSDEMNKYLESLQNEMNKYVKVLQNGLGSDDRFYELEMGLKTLESKYLELINTVSKSQNKNEINTIQKEDKTKNILSNFVKNYFSFR